jgi:hypothetical protein
MRKKSWTSLRRGNSGSRNVAVTDDFAFIAFCIADTARNLAAYAHGASGKHDALTLSKRQLAEIMGQNVKYLTRLIRELEQKAAEEEPDFRPHHLADKAEEG